MIRWALSTFGVLSVIASILGIGVKLFGNDAAAARYFPGSFDTGIYLLIAGLVMLVLVNIVDRLEEIEKKLDAHNGSKND